MLRRAKRTKAIRIGGLLFALALLSAMMAPWLGPAGPNAQRLELEFQFRPPGPNWLMGTDEFGRDVFSRVLWGGRWSLLVGLGAVVVGGGLGCAIGFVAGYFGGRVDRVITASTNLLMSFPSIMIGLIAAAALGSSIVSVVGAIGLSVLPRFVRVARGEVLVIREREFVMSAKASGASDLAILLRHIVPNSASALIVMFTLYFPYAILVESSLSFLGIGMPADSATWGRVVADGREYLRIAPWLSLCPGAVILVTSLGLNLLGDGLRDILDPKVYIG